MSTLALRPRRRHRLGRPLRLVLLAVLALCCALTGVVSMAFANTSHPSASAAPAAPVIAQAAPSVQKVAPVVKPVAARPAPAAPVALAASASPVTTVVRLHSGDTLWGLAQHYGTTVAALQQLNHLGDSTLIYAGTELRISGPAAPAPASRPAAVTSSTYHRTTVVTPRASTVSAPITGSVQQVAAQVFGSQYGCAANIITRESGWNLYATNPSSGAYGLAQALPGGKMASVGADWRTNPATQLRWMRDYVNSRYGGACGAWAFWQAHAWY